MLVCQNAKSDFYLISGLGLRFQSHRKKLYFKYLNILKKVAQSTIHEGLRKGTVKLLVCQQYHHPSQGDEPQRIPGAEQRYLGFFGAVFHQTERGQNADRHRQPSAAAARGVQSLSDGYL